MEYLPYYYISAITGVQPWIKITLVLSCEWIFLYSITTVFSHAFIISLKYQTRVEQIALCFVKREIIS